MSYCISINKNNFMYHNLYPNFIIDKIILFQSIFEIVVEGILVIDENNKTRRITVGYISSTIVKFQFCYSFSEMDN